MNSNTVPYVMSYTALSVSENGADQLTLLLTPHTGRTIHTPPAEQVILCPYHLLLFINHKEVGMPLIEYVCPRDGQTTEILSLHPEHQVPTCPLCLAPMARKPSTFLIRGQFRWYRKTDYGRAGR